MGQTLTIPMLDMVQCVASAADLISPAVVDHHHRVAHIAGNIVGELGLIPHDRAEVVFAGLLHDIGALSFRERIDTLDFELTDGDRHAVLGGRLLEGFDPLASTSRIVRHHHVRWEDGEGLHRGDEVVPFGSHVIHLADRIDVLMRRNRSVLSQVPDIVDTISARSGSWFMPELVEAFCSLARREAFWLDLVRGADVTALVADAPEIAVTLDQDALVDLTEIFSHIIDFRSRFTAVHSAGVAALCRCMARDAGFSRDREQQLGMAGNLHDLGKLAVPSEILEKPFRLEKAEFRVVQTHAYFTYAVLGKIEALADIRDWASMHHERGDGTGYPFHHSAKNIAQEARIVAVADVYTALSEERPYRDASPPGEALNIMRTMAATDQLDAGLVDALSSRIAFYDAARSDAQRRALRTYRAFSDGFAMPVWGA